MVRFKNFALLCLIIVLLVCVSYFYSNALFLFFAGGLGFSFLASVIVTMISVKKLKIKLKSERDFVDKGFVNDVIAEVYSKNIISCTNAKFNFVTENGFYNKKCFFSFYSSLKKEDILIPIKSKYSGKICVTCESVYVSDLFNIVAFKKKFDEKCIFYVLPQEKEVDFNPNEMQKFGAGEETGSESAVNGDVVTGAVPSGSESNMRNIHWKMTVKKNMIMLKEFAESYSNDRILLADILSEPEKTDEVLGVLKAVSFYLISKNKNFYISYCNGSSEMPYKVLVEDESSFFTAYRMLCGGAEPVKGKALSLTDVLSAEAQVFFIGEEKETGKITLIMY